MPEPGKANLFKSWVQWVAIVLLVGMTVIPAACFLAAFLVGRAYPIGASGLIKSMVDTGILSIAISCLLIFVWCSFIAPPVVAGNLKHMRWRDSPVSARRYLGLAPFAPAITLALIGFT
ncbi:MAG: hypothetical protein AAFY08_00285 [Planctomycetota bacterium]